MVTTVVIFIVILGVLIFVHEFGHFILSKYLGVKVEEFGFGFPPRMLRIKRSDTVYSLNWIPLGGFVKIKGESGNARRDHDSFAHRNVYQKVGILAAGVIMNFFLAFVLFTLGFIIGMPQEINDEDVTKYNVRNISIVVVDVEEGSPAQRAGIHVGDTLISINGEVFTNSAHASSFIADHAGEQLAIIVKRGHDAIRIVTKPEQYGTHERPLLGIGMIRAGLVQHDVLHAIVNGFQATISVIVLVVIAISRVLYGLFMGEGLGGQISGPVGVAVVTGHIAQLGIPYLLNFTAMLSINLGVVNILPFPALDGGRILFAIIEKIKGRPVNPTIEGFFHNLGFGLLILLVVFVTYRDLVQYGRQILEGFKQLLL